MATLRQKTPAEAGYSVSVKYGTDKDGEYLATVTNFSPLPETGGNGTLLFVMRGVFMLALGTAWYLRANRMEPAAAEGGGRGSRAAGRAANAGRAHPITRLPAVARRRGDQCNQLEPAPTGTGAVQRKEQ